MLDLLKNSLRYIKNKPELEISIWFNECNQSKHGTVENVNNGRIEVTVTSDLPSMIGSTTTHIILPEQLKEVDIVYK